MRLGSDTPPTQGTTSISSRAFGGPRRIDRFWGFGFFGIMTLIGASLAYFMVAEPALDQLRARAWLPVPCTITASELVEYEDHEGYLYYEGEFSYVYVFGGQELVGDLYALPAIARQKPPGRELVERYPQGMETTCYVDPRDPEWAVLQRDMDWGWGELVFGLLGAGFLLGGLYGLARTVRPHKERRPRRKRAGGPPPAAPHEDGADAAAPDEAAPDERGPDAPVIFVSPGRVRRLLRWFAFVVPFSGFSTLLWVMVDSDVEQRGVLIGALVVFGFATLFLIGATLHAFLALFNPRVRITLERAEIPLGEPLRLRWEILGRAHRLDELRIVLEGVEELAIPREKHNTRDEHTFAELPIVRMEHPGAGRARQGEASIVLPLDTMHSFHSHYTAIRWRLRARGTIRLWPDVNDHFEIVLLPARMP